MSEQNPTRHDSSSHPPSPGGRSLRCEEWEGLLADALDGILPPADSAAFEQHRQECTACARMLEESRQGVAWLGYLDKDPPVPVDLLVKILARTSGPAATALDASAKVELPSAPPFQAWYRTALPMARRMVEPRMWMTVAMAFFSIALTLNLTGIRLSDVRLGDLRPSVVLNNARRQYYSTKEEGVKYYDNLRFVYEMEAKVRELRRTQEPAPQPLPADIQHPQSPSSRNGGPGRREPKLHGEGYSLAAGEQPEIPTHGSHNQGSCTQAERSLA